MGEREKGWYWVKQTGSAFWECCQWNGYAWHGIWIESVPDSAFSEIGTRIPTPDEPYVTRHIKDAEVSGRIDVRPELRSMLAAAPKPGGE